MHSTASDGTDTPSEIVRKASKLGLSLCSVTDHDNVDAQIAAVEQSRRRHVPYISGVELSVRHRGELHILGYGYDVHDHHFQQAMEELRNFRVERTLEIIDRLRALGIDVTLEDVRRHANGNTLGRPHVGLALVEKGYAGSFHEAFQKYLNEGGLCYVNRRKLDAPAAIQLITGAGGIAVVAHPKLISTNHFHRLLSELKEQGLGGIEAYYPIHNNGDVARYLRIADEMDLIVTCGSDYHGSIRPNAIGCEKRTGPQLAQGTKILLDLAKRRGQTERRPEKTGNSRADTSHSG